MMKALVNNLYWLLAILLLSVVGCRSSQQASIRQPDGNTTFDIEQSWMSLTGSYADWNDVELPVKVSLTEPKSFSFSGKAKIINGRVVYMSFRKIGIEVASLYLDNEKIVLISKPLRVAWSEDLSKLSQYGISMRDLQCALFGRVFVPGEGAVRQNSRSSFKLTGADAGTDGDVIWTAKPISYADMLCFFLTTIGNTTSLSNLGINIGKDINIVYGDAMTTDCGAFATAMTATATFHDTDIAANINWSLDKAKWNNGIEVQAPEIPQSCQQLTTEKLLKLLKGI